MLKVAIWHLLYFKTILRTLTVYFEEKSLQTFKSSNLSTETYLFSMGEETILFIGEIQTAKHEQ